jgi:hypothetical protein
MRQSLAENEPKAISPFRGLEILLAPTRVLLIGKGLEIDKFHHSPFVCGANFASPMFVQTPAEI